LREPIRRSLRKPQWAARYRGTSALFAGQRVSWHLHR
jgi:hypothetical protein